MFYLYDIFRSVQAIFWFTPQRKEVYGSAYLFMHDNCWWCGVGTGLCCCSVAVLQGLCFILALCEYCVKNLDIADRLVMA